MRNYRRFCEKYHTPEIYLRWQIVKQVISFHQYVDTIARIEAGLLSKAEMHAIKERYEQFVAGNLDVEGV
jgi:hypothetical protein